MKYVIGMVLGCLFTLGGVKAGIAWEAADAQYDAQNACVKEMVQTVERINIAVGNGTCWEEENGYYK